VDHIDKLDLEELAHALGRVQCELLVLQSLRDELRDIGTNAARIQAARGVPFAEALYDSMPNHCPISGQVWAEIEDGFRAEWERGQ
jgi:hypothetical protein